MKVQNTSKNTELAIETIERIENPENKGIKQTKEEEKIVWFILQRKTDMANKRNHIDKYWKQFVKQYEALFVPYTDGRSSSNVPLERAIIELFVAEAIKRPTNFNITGWVWYDFQARIFEKLWKYDWSINNRDSEILNNEYLTAIFWTSVIYTWYEKKYRVIEDFDGENDDGVVKFQRKLQTKADILMKNIDIRDFWIDERANNVNDAVDCIYETYITYEEFLWYYLDKGYDETKLNAIIPEKSKSNFYRPFLMQEERAEWESRYVKITKYWNTKLDRYFEVANDSILIKEHPILNASHSLPFVTRQYGKNLFSIYGYWLCEALVTFKSDINKLREMLMEAIKKSNQEVIALWNWLSFDWNQFAYNNQFMKFKGNLQWNFQQLSWTPPNQSIFTYLQELFKQIAIFCWIDIMNILWEAQQTAYQTAVQKESSLQRVNVVLKNRDEAFERLADLMKDNYQMFYPIKMVRQLVKINKDNKPMEKVEKTYPEIEVPKMKGKRFGKSKEKELFEIKPDDIRWTIKIEVSTDLNVSTIAEVEKEQKMDFYNRIWVLLQTYAADPTLEQIIPKKKAIMDLAKLNHIDTEQADDAEVNEMKKDLYKELKTAMQWQRTPAEWPRQEANLIWQPSAEISAEGQPATPPNAPNIIR